jgi:hypothetical protein
MTYRTLLFIILILLSVFIWWLTGFNFDNRNPNIAIGFVFNLLIVVMIGLIPNTALDKKV